MRISILICTRNRPDDIRRCLHTLVAADLTPVCEIIVLDQSNQPLDLSDLPGLQAGLVRYVWRPGSGLARARNQALRLASGDIMAFTDDDCHVTPTWPVDIARAFADQPHVDGVFGRVLAYGDASQGIIYHQYRTAFGELTYATRPGGLTCSALIDKPVPASYNRPCMTLENLGSGNNMSFRRAVFERHGLFVELLGAGSVLKSGEDIQFHYRLLKANCTLMYSPDILVYHDRWVTPEENEPLQHGYTVGIVATYLSFALRGDRLAWRYFQYRYGTVKQEVASFSQQKAARKPIRYYRDRALAFARGIAGGIWLAFFQRNQRLPKLRTNQPQLDISSR